MAAVLRDEVEITATPEITLDGKLSETEKMSLFENLDNFPCLWDSGTVSFKDKLKRNRASEELCEQFKGDAWKAKNLPQITVVDRGVSPRNWDSFEWSREKRLYHDSSSDIARVLCESWYPGEEYSCQVRPGEYEVKGRWDKCWWAMSQMRPDWKELTHAEREFLT